MGTALIASATLCEYVFSNWDKDKFETLMVDKLQDYFESRSDPNTNTTETRTSKNLDFIVANMDESVLLTPPQEVVVMEESDNTIWIVIIIVIVVLAIVAIIVVIVYYNLKLARVAKETSPEEEMEGDPADPENNKGVKNKARTQSAATAQCKNDNVEITAPEPDEPEDEPG